MQNEITQPQWHEVSESDIRCWVKDLDAHLSSVDHRRLCVWQDEFSAKWCWEIETFRGSGAAAQGEENTMLDAQRAADQAVGL
jgi:hypothetical protein